MGFVLYLFGVSWVVPRSMTNLLACWKGPFGRVKYETWRAIPLCLMWSIWREKNARTSDKSDVQ